MAAGWQSVEGRDGDGREEEEEEEEEEGLFKADAVNEEDPERGEEDEEEGLFKADATRRRKVYSRKRSRTPSATALPWCRRPDPPYYVPEGESPLSLGGGEEEEG